MKSATKSGSDVLALLVALFVLGGCSLGGRVHFGDVWLGAGHGLALVGNHVKFAIH
jgi:hypothetical protein